MCDKVKGLAFGFVQCEVHDGICAVVAFFFLLFYEFTVFLYMIHLSMSS